MFSLADMIPQATIREVCRERWQVSLGEREVEWIDRSPWHLATRADWSSDAD